MMEEQMDQITRRLGALVDLIFMGGHALRTALGVALGTGISILAKIFKPLLDSIESIDLSSLSQWEYVFIGFFIVHIQTIRNQIYKKEYKLDKNTEEALQVIKKARENGVPEWRTQKMYLELCEKILQNTQLKQATQQEINELLQAESEK